jgi:hypothetical protein
VHGDADVILNADGTLIELKCTSGDFEMKHMLQAVFYGWMQSYSNNDTPLRVIYVLSGHIYEIKRDADAFDNAVRCVLESFCKS